MGFFPTRRRWARTLVLVGFLLSLAVSPALASASFSLVWQASDLGAPFGLLQYPNGVEVSSDGSLTYVADTGNYRVIVLTSAGAPVLQFGTRGSGAGQFNLPTDVAVDAAGNIFVADSMNNRVQKFDSSGSFLLQVGGYGTGAGQLICPRGVAIDRSSNILYVVDTLNHRVARFSSVTGAHLGNWGGFGFANGQFRFPQDAAVDASGNVYITDFVNHRVQKLSSAGAVLAVWGGYGSTGGLFQHPWGIAAGANIYVGDMSNHRIQAFTSTGTLVATYGSYTAGGSGGAGLDHPKGVAARVQSGTLDKLYLAEPGAHAVNAYDVSTGGTLRSSSSSSLASSTLGSSAEAPKLSTSDGPSTPPGTASASTATPVWQVTSIGGPTGPLQAPTGAEVSSDGTLVYAADTGNARVVVLTNAGATVLQFGSFGTSSGQFNQPSDVAVDAGGNIFVSDTMNNRVQKFTSSGSFLFQVGGFGSGSGQLNTPHGIALDRVANVLYVVDTLNHRIARFSSTTGSFLGNWGGFGTGSGQFRYPHDAAVDASGNVYVTDFANHRVQKLSNAGSVLAVWGGQGASAGQFQHPWGIAAGRSIYVSDMSNHRIQSFTTGGTVVSSFGSYAPGGPLGYYFDHAKALAVFSELAGNDRLYLADAGANAVDAYTIGDMPIPALSTVGLVVLMLVLVLAGLKLMRKPLRPAGQPAS